MELTVKSLRYWICHLFLAASLLLLVAGAAASVAVLLLQSLMGLWFATAFACLTVPDFTDESLPHYFFAE